MPRGRAVNATFPKRRVWRVTLAGAPLGATESALTTNGTGDAAPPEAFDGDAPTSADGEGVTVVETDVVGAAGFPHPLLAASNGGTHRNESARRIVRNRFIEGLAFKRFDGSSCEARSVAEGGRARDDARGPAEDQAT